MLYYLVSEIKITSKGTEEFRQKGQVTSDYLTAKGEEKNTKKNP